MELIWHIELIDELPTVHTSDTQLTLADLKQGHRDLLYSCVDILVISKERAMAFVTFNLMTYF